jgi:hypothetical protein
VVKYRVMRERAYVFPHCNLKMRKDDTRDVIYKQTMNYFTSFTNITSIETLPNSALPI